MEYEKYNLSNATAQFQLIMAEAKYNKIFSVQSLRDLRDTNTYIVKPSPKSLIRGGKHNISFY